MHFEHKRRESAWVGYFKGLFHAADARLCVETENWVPGAVSCYYAFFDLTVATLLVSDHNPVVHRGRRQMSLNDALDTNDIDAFRLVTHAQACDFARNHLGETGELFERLKDLREYASYRPSVSIRDDGTTLVNTCEISANEFIAAVRQAPQQFQELCRNFREQLITSHPNDAHRMTSGSWVHCTQSDHFIVRTSGWKNWGDTETGGRQSSQFGCTTTNLCKWI